jgi:hypothetical protein
MERFVIGHNVDPSNWRERLEHLAPRCLEIFIPPRYCEGEGLAELQETFEQIARHPVAKHLEFVSCHFPWGESAGKYSKYSLVDDQYFFPFSEIARGLHDFRSGIGLPPERCALNFHNLYELPRRMLERLKKEGKLPALREALLAHAHSQTQAARRILDVLDTPVTLANENNPPIGDGDRMSIVDVFAEDMAPRASELHTRTCMDLSHFFMTKFYYDLPPGERPSFPYLELECSDGGACGRTLDFERAVGMLHPLYFHVSDTKSPGTSRDFEGLPMGAGDVPWADVLAAMARYAPQSDDKLFLIIEMKGGHTAEGTRLCSSSERELRGLIEDCFASGFLEAISEEESAR